MYGSPWPLPFSSVKKALLINTCVDIISISVQSSETSTMGSGTCPKTDVDQLLIG
jgi:hypothetical protein